MVLTRGEGVQNTKNLTDVICEPQKVLEGTRLEAQLASHDAGAEELRSLKSAFASVEKENSELREHVYILRQENRNAELQVREREQVRMARDCPSLMKLIYLYYKAFSIRLPKQVLLISIVFYVRLHCVVTHKLFILSHVGAPMGLKRAKKK